MNGFARNKLNDKEDKGELKLVIRQLNQIVIIDKSSLTLNDNCSKTGGRSSTQNGPTANKALSWVKDQTNKGSDHITIIAGSKAAGQPLPSHFQLKLVAEDKQANLNCIH